MITSFSRIATASLVATCLMGPVAVATAAQHTTPEVGVRASATKAKPVFTKLKVTVRTRAQVMRLPIKDAAFKTFLANYVSKPVSKNCYPVVHLEGYRTDGWAAGNVNFLRPGTNKGCMGGHWQSFHKVGAKWGLSLGTNANLPCDQVKKVGLPRDLAATCYTDEDGTIPNPVP